ncbi:c-type cytochrome [Massilia sp. Mn16-1_5]|uniref:c-type cytochrome n=1 Tax=Massilia sp. Mn16-1_5 TaxID=2079199 RepID=UPI001E5426A6|nr:c-type cytochrome [Massilia sp. Mn16-1_5]
MRWTLRILGALVLLGLLVGVTAHLLSTRKMQRTVPVDVSAIAVPNDPARIAHGRYLYSTRGCTECHGATGTGKTVIDSDGMLVVAPNITRGANSATTAYQVVDWVRTIRHGVKPNGQPVIVMPSEDYARLTDEDTGALVAYLQQLPPLPGERRRIDLPLPVKLLYAVGGIKDAAEKIDHSLPPPRAQPAAVTAAHGAYVAQACIGCHGAQLSGGAIPGAPPAWPQAANLTPGPGSAMLRYPTAESFLAMLRSGKRPDGSTISPVMPFASFGQMNDVDARALHAYLQTLPPRPAGQH